MSENPVREFHAVANLFPLLEGAAFEELVVDIRKNGLREPILIDANGRIVDGRNRYRACLAAGVKPRYATWQGEGSLAELSLSLNLRRRHLGESQRAMVAAKLAKTLEPESLKRRSRLAANLQQARGRSSGEAAALVNVSPRLTYHAVKVLQTGCAELIAAVESGALAVSSASALAGLPHEEQKKVVAGGAREAARKIRDLRAGPAPSPRPSPGQFGVMVSKGAMPHRREKSGSEQIVFLWVAAAGLEAAVDALQARGFRCASLRA